MPREPETPRARQAWADYLALGPGRTVDMLHRLYVVRVNNQGKSSVPSVARRTLWSWYTRFGWRQRVSDIAEREVRESQEREALYRREIMETGYAQVHERVRVLKELAVVLSNELLATVESDNRLWVDDVRIVSQGRGVQTTVPMKRFNDTEVEQLRGLLDDIAREKGERKQVGEISGPDGGPIPFADLGDEEGRALRLIALLQRFRERRDQASARQPPQLGAPAGSPDDGVS